MTTSTEAGDLTYKSLLDLLFDERALKLRELEHSFNPFRVLNIQRYEIRHVSTLAWLLDPQGSHNLGDAFLLRFMNVVAQEAEDQTVRSILALAPEPSVRVRREVSRKTLENLERLEFEESVKAATDTSSTKEASLDLLVEGDRWVLGLEAKIDSSQHSDQLQTYRTALEKGAPSKQRVLIFLTKDDADVPQDRSWTHVTWQSAVIQPLRAILDGMYGRAQSHSSEFLRSYLEVLEDQCCDSAGTREGLLKDLAASYEKTLDHVIGRTHGKLGDRVVELVTSNSWLFRELARVYEPANKKRYVLLKRFVEALPDVVPVESGVSVLRWIPKEWKDYPVVMHSMNRFPSVVCELLNNRDYGYRFKLMITNVGEQFKETKCHADRVWLCNAAQRHERSRELFRASLYANGEPLELAPKYPALALTEFFKSDKDSDIQRAYEKFLPSIDAMTELLRQLEG